MLPNAAAGQSAPANGNTTKVVRAVRVDSPPAIDRRLEEAVWGQADVITDFHQIRPGDGTSPSERTEVDGDLGQRRGDLRERMDGVSLLQYDNVSEVIGVNTRLN